MLSISVYLKARRSRVYVNQFKKKKRYESHLKISFYYVIYKDPLF